MATSFSLDKFASASPLDRARAVARGLPVSALRDLVADRSMTLADVARAVGARRTLDRRLKEGTPLSPRESDRLARLVTVLGLATEIFGDRAEAMRWLGEPKAQLDDQAPLDLMKTDVGARAVEDYVLQMRHGFFA
ncbi:MAG: DUF2384 domain-containing protein [Sphingomonas sp.]|uniref:type II RES/Xre toxin-antitoxin system antitoxin n=1 Tax=Sphingomonas sp. TaxID=28214 RepID=UPI0025FE413C|nr:antitoxin Xre/MbcA/ParS toxin-binding domain-containing protein [Sphingomonas sp.]MBY0282738.1 DUF2384 domain-containing protein [Sphingomonas sp.]